MFRIKMQYPDFKSEIGEKVLGICGAILLVPAGIFKIVFKDYNLSVIFMALALSAWYPLIILIVYEWWKGYIIEDDGIYFKHRFLKHKILYKNIRCIIISNGCVHNIHSTYMDYKKKIAPWLTIMGGETDKILKYCMEDNPRRHVLRNIDIEYVLGADIGCYNPENFYKIFSKKSWKIYNYGFVWNIKNTNKILKAYTGDYYIASSISSNYSEEIKTICEKYGINNERIHIIEDSTNGEFVWHN